MQINVKNFFKPAQNQKPTERKLKIQNYTFPGNMRIGQKAKLLIALLKEQRDQLPTGYHWSDKLEGKKTIGVPSSKTEGKKKGEY